MRISIGYQTSWNEPIVSRDCGARETPGQVITKVGHTLFRRITPSCECPGRRWCGVGPAVASEQLRNRPCTSTQEKGNSVCSCKPRLGLGPRHIACSLGERLRGTQLLNQGDDMIRSQDLRAHALTLSFGLSLFGLAACDEKPIPCETTTYELTEASSDVDHCSYVVDVAEAECRMTAGTVYGTGIPPGSATLALTRTGTPGGYSDFSTSGRTPNASGTGWAYTESQLACGGSPGQSEGCVNGQYIVTVEKGNHSCGDFGDISLELPFTN